MNILDIIEKKRDGKELNKQEINFFVSEYVKNNIPDYQISALLMAMFINNISFKEIVNLTNAMICSGDTICLREINGIKADKHSTGGVGDKTSLVVGPLVASCNVKFAKMSGRGLGHTGGTLDKLESIPGMSITLTNEKFKKQVNSIGISIIGQNTNLVPADKKLYALRDVTATVENIGLIASSIMSKKIASGSDTILLDVKVGSGAFMKTLQRAKELSTVLVKIGRQFKKDTRVLITNMQEPLGYAVGNILEVKEAIATLKNEGPEDFTILCRKCASVILLQSKIVNNEKEALKMINDKLISGEAFSKFKEFIKAQGGDISYIDNPNKFNLAKHVVEVRAEKTGYIKEINALSIGKSAMQLGAGRKVKTDNIDFAAGIVLKKKVGDYVKRNDVICVIHTNKKNFSDVISDIKNAFVFSDKKVDKQKIIIDYIS
ncbi:MAG: thymidine phosphorylase [Bacilli bacterium]|nr:thymidine phosphorylase [Bacilli bacterium]